MSTKAAAPLLLLLMACAATPADDPFVVPERPIAYRKPDCPSTTARPAGRRGLRPVGKIPTLAGQTAGGALVVTHGGAGSKPELADGPQAAADAALSSLNGAASALEAAIAGTVIMEDDPRFNAGTGSNIRLDGKTIQMDASLMTDAGDFAAVAVIERVQNPIKVARLVLDSPHVLMAGEGATRFAHKMGMKDVVPVSAAAKKKYEARMAKLAERAGQKGEVDWRSYWNFPGEMPAEMKKWRKGGDTVGTVTRAPDGSFAAALSTGGTSVTLYGRVGDVPVYGAGVFAGPAGAVACTGTGEEIIRRALAKTVYEMMSSGVAARDAIHQAVLDFPSGASVGLIAVDKLGWGVGSNESMAYGMAAAGD